MGNPFDVQALALDLCNRPLREAIATLDDLLTWDSPAGSAECVAQMEFGVRLVTAMRIECERRGVPALWLRPLAR